jgi:hypothetical protein
MIEIRRSFAVLAFDGWMLLACALITLSIARVQTVAAADLQPQLSRCRTDSECRKGFKCYAQVPGIGLKGACVPRGPSGPDDDEQVCLHKANCAAAAALRRVCPACVITPIVTCGGVPSSDAWYRERWERLKDCLSWTPEQIRAAVVPTASQTPNPKGLIVIEQMPILSVDVNDWNIHVPGAWYNPRNEDRSGLYQREGQLQTKLSRLWEFNAACPINEEDIRSRTTTSRLIAGTCGGFRNPDPTKPPPSLMYPRTP